MNMCARCDERPAIGKDGLCGHCTWAVRAEIEEGLYKMREYLRAHAAFADWENTHREET